MNAVDYLTEVLVSHVSQEEAAHVLAHVSDAEEGYEAGSFTRSLIEAIFRADPNNQRLLGLGFPGYVAAVQLYQIVNDGHQRLREIAARR